MLLGGFQHPRSSERLTICSEDHSGFQALPASGTSCGNISSGDGLLCCSLYSAERVA